MAGLSLLVMFLSIVEAPAQTLPLASTEASDIRVPTRFLVAARPLVIESVDGTSSARAIGAVHPLATLSKDLGHVQSSLLVEHLQLNLRRPNERQAAFDALVDALHQPNTDVYHHWLTGEEIGAQFGPSVSDIASIRSYLESEGFTVQHVGKSGMFVDFSGTAEQVEKSFHTEIHNLITPDGRRRYSAITPAWLPAALTQAGVSFIPISNIEGEPAFRARVDQVPGFAAHPNDLVACGSGTCNNVGPQDFYTIYNERPIISAGANNGAGVTIALLEPSDINQNDVTYFRTMFNVVPNTPTLSSSHGSQSIVCSDPKFPTVGEEQEAVLDAEWAGAVAPGASLLVMSCPTEYLSAEAVVEDDLASIMSLSYIDSELNGQAPIYSALWEQAAAQGQTVVVCAGDTGSASNVPGMHTIIATKGAVVNAYASSSYNVAAGGTDFQDTYNLNEGDASYGPIRYWNAANTPGDSSALSYVPETTWNNSCAGSLVANGHGGITPNAFCDADPSFGNLGGSGGVSNVNPRPTWQSGTVYGIPASTGIYTYRLVPDISFFASPGFWSHSLAYYQSDAMTPLGFGGGTSFVAPQVAGIFALISQKTGARLGQPNYVLYSLAGSAYGISNFSGGDCNGSGAAINTGTTGSIPGGSCIFNDVVTGNNSQECTTGTNGCYSDNGKVGILSTSTAAAQPAYLAGPGYDLATGIGSANISNLVNAWPSPSFALSVNPGALSISVGQSATAIVAVSPVNGYSSAVSFSCSGLPAFTTCSFSPASVAPSASPATSALTITTDSTIANAATPSNHLQLPIYAGSLFPALAIAVLINARRNRPWVGTGSLLVVISILFLPVLVGCWHSSGTPEGTYKVIVTASSTGNGALTQSSTLTVTVTN